ncbi:MAG: lysophospholipid acyltransferase family protein [Candidatus Omnitrophota bacterium]|jgi:1-acyl-sn-glycerol-3-phosphate acyltransferase
MPYKLSRFIIFLFLKVCFWLKAEGRENIPEKGGVIIASNHLSYLDPLAVGCACPRVIDFMARDSLFKVPVLGSWMRAVGAFGVKRNNADISAMKEAIYRLQHGRVLTLFPEGTRQVSVLVSTKVEPGVGFLAAKSGAAVIPAFISGTEKAFPRGAKFFRFSRIRVKFGAAVKIDKDKPYEAIAQDILKDIRLLAVRAASKSS